MSWFIVKKAFAVKDSYISIVVNTYFLGAGKAAVGFEPTIPVLRNDALDHLATLPSIPYGNLHIT